MKRLLMVSFVSAVMGCVHSPVQKEVSASDPNTKMSYREPAADNFTGIQRVARKCGGYSEDVLNRVLGQMSPDQAKFLRRNGEEIQVFQMRDGRLVIASIPDEGACSYEYLKIGSGLKVKETLAIGGQLFLVVADQRNRSNLYVLQPSKDAQGYNLKWVNVDRHNNFVDRIHTKIVNGDARLVVHAHTRRIGPLTMDVDNIESYNERLHAVKIRQIDPEPQVQFEQVRIEVSYNSSQTTISCREESVRIELFFGLVSLEETQQVCFAVRQ